LPETSPTALTYLVDFFFNPEAQLSLPYYTGGPMPFIQLATANQPPLK